MDENDFKELITSSKLDVTFEYWGIEKQEDVNIGDLKQRVKEYCALFGHVKVHVNVNNKYSHSGLFVVENDAIEEYELELF